MQNLENKIENSPPEKVRNSLGRIKDSVAGKIAVYSLAGVLSAGLYACSGSSNDPDAKEFVDCSCAEVLSFCEAAGPSYCQTDDDCICDFEKQFKGNKEYADKCVEKAYAINPNFCSKDEFEIAGQGEGMVCTDNICSWGQKYNRECIDNDNDESYPNKECASGPENWDCDDYNPNINPDAEEICNGMDDNCNGKIDEENICDNCPDEFEPCDTYKSEDCEDFSGTFEVVENNCQHHHYGDLTETSFIISLKNKCNVSVVSKIEEDSETVVYCEFGGERIYFAEGNYLAGPFKGKGCYPSEGHYLGFTKCGCYIQAVAIHEDMGCQIILKYKTPETLPNKCDSCE